MPSILAAVRLLRRSRQAIPTPAGRAPTPVVTDGTGVARSAGIGLIVEDYSARREATMDAVRAIAAGRAGARGAPGGR